MSKKNLQLVFFVGLTLGLLALLFFIFKPFFGIIFIAGVFAISFYSWYEKLSVKLNGRKNLAALLITLVVLFVVIVPVVIFSVLLLKEAVALYNNIAFGGGPQGLLSQMEILSDKIGSLFSFGVSEGGLDLSAYGRQALNWIIGNFGSISAFILNSVFAFFLMLISLYYFFIFGERIKRAVIKFSPLPDQYDEEFAQTLKSSIDAVLRGRILVSLIQGLFIGIGFAFFGIGSPVLWGFVGGVASLIPVLGTSVVTVPAVAYLFLTHHIGSGIGLLIWGALAVGFIDNIMSVIFLRNKIKVHPLIVLFSILGGVELFGVVGFLVGPVIVSAFIALLKIYPFIMINKEKSE